MPLPAPDPRDLDIHSLPTKQRAPVVESIDQESANALAELYGAAVMGALVQNPALGGPAEGCDFHARRSDEAVG